MADFTKNAIKSAFLKLLGEKPISRITVKDIVEECGINRNSFYYHFRDIPALTEELVDEQLEKLVSSYSPDDPIGVFMNAVVDYAEANRNLALHVYRYMDREQFESGLLKYCSIIARAYAERAFKDTAVANRDRELLSKLLACECFGLLVEWVAEGMPSGMKERIERICSIHAFTVNGLIRAAEQGQ